MMKMKIKLLKYTASLKIKNKKLKFHYKKQQIKKQLRLRVSKFWPTIKKNYSTVVVVSSNVVVDSVVELEPED